VLTVVLVVGLAVAPAHTSAQDPVVEQRPFTAGLDRPVEDFSGEGDASSLELNPALLGAVQGVDLVLRGYNAVSDTSRGTGYGGWLSLNLFGVALGVGAQLLQPGLANATHDFDAEHNFPATKLSLGLAAGDAERGSIGVGISGLRLAGARLRQPDLDLGAMLRMTNYASLGLAARLSPIDLRPEPWPAEVGLVGELALRPLGTRHLELAGGVRTRIDAPGEDSDLGTRVYPRARAALRWQGLALLGQVEQIETTTLDAQTLAPRGPTGRTWRGSVALELAWDFVGAGAGAQLGGSGPLDGIGYVARFSSGRQGRVFWPRKVDIERLDLASIGDQRALVELLGRVDRARRAGERSILLVDARDIALGWGSVRELRDALVAVRRAGGHVFAWIENGGMLEYYLASAAERVYTHPAADLQIVGLKSVGIYFAQALAKLGVRVEALHIGEFKSAHERWSRASRSASDRRQVEAILDDTFDVFVTDVAQARSLTKTAVRELVDRAPLGPEEAKAAGLVDAVVFRDELAATLSEHVGADVEIADMPPATPEEPTWSAEPYVAVVLVDGTLVEGESRSLPVLGLGNTGADTIVEILRALGKDAACRGIVVRVDSPGGSAIASDLIWREIDRARAAWKKDGRSSPPIAVSMADVAGSGGYYVALGGGRIFAQPTTITGSIGVVALHVDVSGLLGILGVAVDTIKRGDGADAETPWQPWSPAQREALEGSARRTYDLFVARVAQARGKTREQVDELGRGRVYSGRDALELGLVDELGGLDQALAWVREQSGVGRRFELPIRVLPERVTLLDLLLDNVGPVLATPAVRARDRRAAGKAALPPVLDRALARLPLAALFLPSDAPSARMDPEIRIE
jgi:protease-4